MWNLFYNFRRHFVDFIETSGFRQHNIQQLKIFALTLQINKRSINTQPTGYLHTNARCSYIKIILREKCVVMKIFYISKYIYSITKFVCVSRISNRRAEKKFIHEPMMCYNYCIFKYVYKRTHTHTVRKMETFWKTKNSKAWQISNLRI